MMEELACFMDWDLEAIVRGCSIKAPVTTTIMEEDPHPNFSHHFFPEVEDDTLFSFPEFSESTRVFDELEELYKPFYPVFHTLSSPDQAIVSTSPPIPKEAEEEEEEVKLLIKPSQKVLAPQDLQAPAASKSKRSKKSVNKKVVKEVEAADIGVSDPWAWRKYGQKPIKGSPYPRSYYRCSSCKGCLARKQVERSNKDPGVFLVTYTAEHSNHPQPTRRNSLSGSTRKNISTVAPLPSNASCSSNSSSAVSLSSPRTPLVLVESMDEDEIVTSLQQSSEGLIIKKEVDFVKVLDDGWFPTTELDELIIRGCDFIVEGV